MSGGLGWYVRRLRRMSAGELTHRARDYARQKKWATRQVRQGSSAPPLAGLRPELRVPVGLHQAARDPAPTRVRATVQAAADQVLAEYGEGHGKGEALWKSLYAATGDIIVWADTDVKNWHHRMVYGTLGPLLVEPRLQYVKGYYQRPIVEDGTLKEGGGGRVTELVARPLINLFYPELSGMIQPLAGEYAGRRSLLETIPFFTGYAVEIGHLIDAAERLGIEGLGQVDLERRVHRNQELEGLSRMSFVILQAVMKRLEERHKARLFAEMGSTMKLPRSGKGRLGLEVIELADQERPPMIRIPEYVEQRRVLAGGEPR